MALVLAQFVGRGGVVAEPRQLQPEGRLPVAQIDQHERAVGGLLPADLPESQCLGVKFQAAVEIGHIDVEMVESALYFHNLREFVVHKFRQRL